MRLWQFGTIRAQKKASEHRYILCLDGGGMRGIIPATIIASIAKRLRTNGDERPFYSHFDLISGTSTGGLLALALSSPCSPSSLLAYPHDQSHLSCDPSLLADLYVRYGSTIFPRTQSLFQFNVIGQLFTHKYDDLPFKRVLYDVFADSRLADALVPTMVVTYDIGNDRPQLLSSYDTPFVPIRTAARATSAAPTYFAPASVVLDDSTAPHSLVDGGVVANNPVLYAYREAKKLYPDAKMFHILSISTAHSSYKLEIEKSNSGVIGWLDPAKGAPIYRLYASSQMRTSSEIAASLPDLEYVRIHSDLERHIKLDETDAHELNYLIQSAKKIEAAHQTQIESFCQQLQNRPIHPLRPTGTIG